MSESITYKEYFTITAENVEKYGPKTILLMQVGSFMEIYGLKDPNTNEINGSQIVDVCQMCQLNISEKKSSYKNQQVLMAGVRDYALDKYLPKMIDGGYNVVVYVQEKTAIGIVRVFDAVYSPGTFLSSEDNTLQITNNIMCVWMEKVRNRNNTDTLICGFSTINILTGQSYIFEHETQYLLNPTTFDELERAISVFAPSEIILISCFDEKTANSVHQYANIQSSMVHFVSNNPEQPMYASQSNKTSEKVQNCEKQTYITHILTTFFGNEAHNQCNEFSLYPIATQSFCFLLDFVQEHNGSLVKKIALPIFNNTTSRMILANHTLKQLNIIDDNQSKGQYSSVMACMNKCCSSSGKRLFKQQLTNPCFDEFWLNNEYAIIDVLRNMSSKDYQTQVDGCRKILSSVSDIEKFLRKAILRKVSPYNVYQTYQTVQSIAAISELIESNAELVEYTNSENNDFICSEFSQFTSDYFKIEECQKVQTFQSNFDTLIIQPGVSKELDGLIAKHETNEKVLEGIYQNLNKIMRTTPKDEKTEFVRKHETEKSGISLQMTKRRAITLKSLLNKTPEKTFTICDNDIKYKDIQTQSASGSADEITFPLLNKILKERLSLQEQIAAKTMDLFQEYLRILEKHWTESIQILACFVSQLDVILNKVHVAKKYNHCCPEIQTNHQNKDPEQSYLCAKDMRHCLIENIQTSETYVPNDVHMGCDDQDGILLYGTNAVGKTSFIRSIGICIVLAQCGMFVPCSQFIYKPYKAIYSRILGNDNLFKGLSTFAVEISELRVILRMANENSLILGDEVCSGTETESALSIFVSALMHIHEKQSSFIFATHFHEIVKYEEVQNLNKMALYHMHVVYDREEDCLIYDRKLKPGSGTRMYGLEVCKSLYLDEDFLEKAYNIRNKYFPDQQGGLSLSSSTYNSKKLRGLCEMCKTEFSDEVHHMAQQKDADENGFVNGFHKNHPGNLMAICEKCHDKIHKENITVRKKKTTKGVKTVKC